MTTDTPNELGHPPAAPVDRILWRVDSQPREQKGGGHVAMVVPYLSAAVVADLFDRWVGPERWSDTYEPTDDPNAVWCHLSVWDRLVGWVTKSDVGYMEGTGDMVVKGRVSDAFKRAAVLKWGVGRNVYLLPTLWVPVAVNNRGQAVLTADSRRAIRKRLADLGYDTTTDAPTDAPTDDEVDQRTEDAAMSPTSVITAAKRRVLDAAAGDRDRAAEAWQVALDSLGFGDPPAPALVDLVVEAAIEYLVGGRA